MSREKGMGNEPHKNYDTILVLDFGSQYSHLITRRLRELNIYSEMLPCTTRLSDLSYKPAGVILSGGPWSVYAEQAPHADPAVFNLSVPLLGICYGLQWLAWHHGKGVVAGARREYGYAKLMIEKHSDHNTHIDRLFDGLGDSLEVWMSHGTNFPRNNSP